MFLDDHMSRPRGDEEHLKVTFAPEWRGRDKMFGMEKTVEAISEHTELNVHLFLWRGGHRFVRRHLVLLLDSKKDMLEL